MLSTRSRPSSPESSGDAASFTTGRSHASSTRARNADSATGGARAARIENASRSPSPVGTPMGAYPVADVQAEARGREALLAREFEAAEQAFSQLRRSQCPDRQRDGEVGLAMVALLSRAPDTAAAARGPRPAERGTGGTSAATSSAAPAPPAPPAPSARLRTALQTLRGEGPATRDSSALVLLGQMMAELQAGSLEDAWCRIACAPNCVEKVLAAASYRIGRGDVAAAQEALARALGLFSGTVTLGIGRSQATRLDTSPAAAAALRGCYATATRVSGSHDAFAQAKAMVAALRLDADGSFVAMANEVMGAADGETRHDAWLALTARWPRSVEAAQLGVRFGFLAPEARQELLQERAEDAVTLAAAYAGALGAEDWPAALDALEKLYVIRPNIAQAGQLAWLGERCGKGEAWVAERRQWALNKDDTQPQARLAEVEAAIAAKKVDEAMIARLRQLADSGQPEARVYLARALGMHNRNAEALEALDTFLQPGNAASGQFGSALLLRAKHRLYERGPVILDHEAACASLMQARADLQRIPAGHPAYQEAIELQPFLATRIAQLSTGIRYTLDELQVRAELAGKHFDRVRANINHHGNSIQNSESELYWQLMALTYEAMGPGHAAKAIYAASNAVDLALMRNRTNTAAEEILRRLNAQREGALRRVLTFFNSILRWFAGVLGTRT